MITKTQLNRLHPSNWIKPKNMTDTIKTVTKEVDVEKLATELEEFMFGKGNRYGKYRQHLIDIINPHLQSNAGGFSLEDMRKIVWYFRSLHRMNQEETEKEIDKFAQSLTKEQPKGFCTCEIPDPNTNYATKFCNRCDGIIKKSKS